MSNRNGVPRAPAVSDQRMAAGVEALRHIDGYKVQARQHGKMEATVNYDETGRASVAISDTVRIRNGTGLLEAVRLVKLWLDAVAEQEIDQGDSGHAYELQVQISGKHATITSARTTRTRTDSGPTSENAVDTARPRH